jgi:hypothetical protein
MEVTVIDLHKDECGDHGPYLQRHTSKQLPALRIDLIHTNKKPITLVANLDFKTFFALRGSLIDSKMLPAFIGTVQ